MQVISRSVYEVSNDNGVMLVLLSGSDEFFTDAKPDGYLFSINYDMDERGHRTVSICDMQAESMAFKGKYYIIMDGDNQPYVTNDIKMRYDHNIVTGYFRERISPYYIETIVLDMDNLSVCIEDDTHDLLETIKDIQGDREHERQEMTWGL